jgi:hypothetical protein
VDRDDDGVIRNVVIHITNEQPLLADLFETPSATDVSLVCTNVRMLDGKKPIFIDRSTSVFVFPYLNVRFIEFTPGAATDLAELSAGDLGDTTDHSNGTEPEATAEPEVELELDEDFLRRIREV